MKSATSTRRTFFKQLAGAAAAGWTLSGPAGKSHARSGKPRIAGIVTEYRSFSHADVLLGRMIKGYSLGLEAIWPRTHVVSMFVDQSPKGDLSRPIAAKFGIEIMPTIEQALTLGTGKLAVDGVVIIGEHGDYPTNEIGQLMYPRRRFFEETAATFRKTDKAVPVFNDKHLGFAWNDAKWMYDTAREMQFPLMAGSSLPTTWRKPDLEIALGTPVKEAIAIGYSDIEAYGFHALETLQCMVERRAGGETGVHAVTCLRGADVWKAADAGVWSWDVLAAALKPSHQESYDPRERSRNPTAFVIEYADGLKGTVLMLDGLAREFSFGARLANPDQVVGTEFWLQEPVFGHFSYLAHNIEEMFLTGKEVSPPERTLLTTGILDAAMHSRYENRRIETPWLTSIRYQANGSTSRRARFDGALTAGL